MQRCARCGGNVPDNAVFCVYCGSTFNAVMDRPLTISDYPTARLPAFTPTSVSTPRMSTLTGKKERIIRTTIGEYPTSLQPMMPSHAVMPTFIIGEQSYTQVDGGYDMVEQIPFEDIDHQEWQRQSLLTGAASAGMLANGRLAPFGNLPMTQGTPFMNGAPLLQGTPLMNGAPLAQGISAASSHSSVFPGEDVFYSPSSASPPTTPPDASWQSFPAERATPSWGLPPAPLSASQVWHKQRHRRRTGKFHAHNALLKGVFISISGLLILATLVAILLAVFPPTLTLNGVLSGNAVVTSGGSLHVHGSGFVPLGAVDLMLDTAVPLAQVGMDANGRVLYGIVRAPHIHGTLARTKATRYALSLTPGGQPKNLGASATVGIDGIFDATIAVGTDWPLGPHTIHARERLTGRETGLSFRIVAQKSLLRISATTLDFGKLQAGNKATLPIVISNAGPETLTWAADVSKVSWLKLQSSLGKIDAGGLEQVLNVTVDASHLVPRRYTAPLNVTSSGGNALVNIVVEVVPNTGKPQAVLRVTPSTLSFGTLGATQQATILLEVANVGAKSLSWHASTGGANWLMLDTSTGAIQAAGIPESIHVTVDTTKLANGPYSGTLQITSNGGNVNVPVSLNVTGSTVAPGTPTPNSTPPPPPTLIVSPSGFNANTDCGYNAGQGWTCTATVSNLKSTQATLNWSATTLGINGVTLTPSSGNLTPGQSMAVSIFVPNTVCPTNADLTFSGAGNAQDVLWSCATPQISASPRSLPTGCVSCVVTLSMAQGAQGDANWSASSPYLAGVTFFPSQGVLLAGQPLQVVVTVPAAACPPSAAFAFQGPANTSSITWTCIPPKLTVSSTNLDFGTLQAGKTGTHTVRIGNSGGRPLNWNADTGGTSWLTLNNMGSMLAPGSSTTLNVTVNSATLAPGGYSATVNITSDGGKTSLVIIMTVASPPAALKVKPTNLSFNAVQAATTPSTQAFTVSNVGGQPLNWTAQTDGSSWLSLDNSGTTVAPGSAVTVHVKVNPTGLAAGSYSATVHVSSNGGNAQIGVTLTVTASPPVLMVNPGSLNFNNISQGNTSTQTFKVSDSGGQPLTWTAQTDGSSWLSIDNTGSTINGGTSTNIHVTVNTTSLTGGQSYSATITVNSNGGGPIQVSVQLTVAAPLPPKLCNLSPGQLNFGSVTSGASSTLTLTFSNCGGLPLMWTASGGDPACPQGWLCMDNNSGNLSPGQRTSIQVTVDTAATLPAPGGPGSYPATIMFSTNEANGGNESVGVSVTVLPGPSASSASPSSLNFLVFACAVRWCRPLSRQLQSVHS
jgi:uncharacterized membrane protein